MLRVLKHVALAAGIGVMATVAVYKVQPSWTQEGDLWTLRLKFTPRWTSE
jgi:hypothetical protein